MYNEDSKEVITSFGLSLIAAFMASHYNCYIWHQNVVLCSKTTMYGSYDFEMSVVEAGEVHRLSPHFKIGGEKGSGYARLTRM